jgi:hypothetical protein
LIQTPFRRRSEIGFHDYTETNIGERITRSCPHGTGSCPENVDDVVATSGYFLALQVKTEEMV